MLPVAVNGAEADQYVLPGLTEPRAAGILSLARPSVAIHAAANEDVAPVMRYYQVRCQRELHSAVVEAARRAGTSAVQLVRCALAILPPETLENLPDPGAPRPRDAARVGRRLETPILRLRLPVGLTASVVRRVLGFVVDTAAGRNMVMPTETGRALRRDLMAEKAQTERLSEALGVLAGEPLDGGVSTREHALHVLRFPPGAKPTPEALTRRFRALAGVLHPDVGMLDHHGVMAQLLDARRILMRM